MGTVCCGLLIVSTACRGWAEEKKTWPTLLDALVAMKEQDGKENAALYYVTAGEKAPGWPNEDEDFTIIWRVVRDGWFPGAEKLLPFLEEYAPSIDLMRKGASIGYARWPSDEDVGYRYWKLEILERMFLFETRYLEHQGDYEGALRNYMTLITVARDLTLPEPSLIDDLLGIAHASRPLKGVTDLLRSGSLSRDSVRSTLSRLQEIDASWVPITEGLRSEISVATRIYRKAQTDPAAAGEELEKEVKTYQQEVKADGGDLVTLPEYDVILEGDFTIGELVADATRIAEDLRTLWEFEVEHFQKPPWERDSIDYQGAASRLRKSLHPYVTQGLNPYENFVEADKRYRVLLAKLRGTELAAAVALYRLDHDAAPRSLEQLMPEYLDALPVDPFTGKPLRYRPWSDEGGGAIYSLGPDREDDRMKIEYDATNGTISKGDVFLR